MYGPGSKLTLDFEGNNNTALNFDKTNFKHRFEIENPEVENLLQNGFNVPQNLTPLEQIQDANPVTLQVNLPNSPNITIPYNMAQISSAEVKLYVWTGDSTQKTSHT